jgi:hypothetical protein
VQPQASMIRGLGNAFNAAHVTQVAAARPDGQPPRAMPLSIGKASPTCKGGAEGQQQGADHQGQLRQATAGREAGHACSCHLPRGASRDGHLAPRGGSCRVWDMAGVFVGSVCVRWRECSSDRCSGSHNGEVLLLDRHASAPDNKTKQQQKHSAPVARARHTTVPNPRVHPAAQPLQPMLKEQCCRALERGQWSSWKAASFT